MRTTTLLLLCLAAMLLVTACSPSADFSTESNGTAVQFASVAVSSNGPYTRSVATITTGKLGVFRTTHNSYTVQNNVEYGYNGSIWSSAVPMAVGASDAHLIVYYPYLAAGITYASNPDAITINSQKYTKEQDLCYDTLYDVSTTNYKLNPVLKHAYAKLTFVIRKKDATYSSSCAVSNISISHANILKTGTISLMKGTYGSGTAGTVNYNPGIASVALGDSAVTSALMVPTTKLISGDIALSFTIDGYKTSATLDAVDCGLTSLEAGKNYTIPVTISGKQLIITKVSVTPWSTGHTCSADVPIPIINAQPESNCYIVKPSTTISIPVSRVSTAGITTLTSTWSAGVLWEEGTSINGIIRNKNYIQLTAGSTDGNAVVFIKDPNGTIIWSWHIWVTNYNPNTDNFSAGGYTWMKRNLGALSYDTDESCFGLYYQWGRKDPFRRESWDLGVKVEEWAQNPEYFINHPDFFCEQNNPNAGGWSKTAKSFFEPCPSGWKLPPPEAWNSLWNSGDTELTSYSREEATGYLVPQYLYGYYFPSEFKFGFWAYAGTMYPDASSDNGWGGSGVEGCGENGWAGRMGLYWTNNNRDYFRVDGRQNAIGRSRIDGFKITAGRYTAFDQLIFNSLSVRCIKE